MRCTLGPFVITLAHQYTDVSAFVSSPGRYVTNHAIGTSCTTVARTGRSASGSVVMMGRSKGGKKKEDRMKLIESVAAAERGVSKVVAESEEDGEGGDGGGEDSNVFNVDRLRAETKTPFRTLRVFIYGGFGFSAFIGGLTALSQLAATLGEQEGSLELSKVLINLLVDFSVMAVAAFCYNFETSQQEGLEEAMAKTREKKNRLKATKITGDVNAERVKRLRGLTVKVPGSARPDGSGSRKAPVGVLMDEANQAFCVLAGSREYIRDSMVSAMLSKNQMFPSLNLLVVPVEMSIGGSREGAMEPVGGKGFAKAMRYEDEGYVAEAVDEEDWKDIMREEVEAAQRQGATKAAVGDDGIVLVVSREGKVLRRGVGVPIWKTIRDDIDPPKKKKEKK